METVQLTSDHNIIVSESDKNSDTLDVKFIICDFKPNDNNVVLNRHTISSWLDTLKFKPVVGKVITRYDGKRDFSGHNVKIVHTKDENGNLIQEVEFDTSAFGSFYDVSIEEIDGKEYITASAKIWKRFKEACSIIKSRAKTEKGLKTSWEIQISESHQEIMDGKEVKVIDKGTFIGHALLGEHVDPAYKSSGVISVASKNVDFEIANALSNDVLKLMDIEGGKNKVSKMKEENVKLSAMTDNDLYDQLRKAINLTDENKMYYIAFIYPYEFKVIAYDLNRENEEDFVEFTYTVNSDDTVSIVNQKNVKMRFVSVDEMNETISDLQSKLKEAEKDIAEAGKTITDLTKEIEKLEAQIVELTKYKEKVEELEEAQKQKELAEKREALIKYALEDDLIEKSELEKDETLSHIFASLTLENFEECQEKIDVIKGRRAIEKYRKEKQENIEFSSNAEKAAKSNLDSDQEGVINAIDAVKNWLFK